jgi:hypothetical protein
MRFAVQLREVIAKQGALGRCHLLQAETGALVAEGKERFQLGNEELQVLLAYLRASELFYDCLQLAYTPDRPAFEERIFLPAPVS